MVSAGISWFELQMPEFRSFKYCKQHIPDQSTLRKHYLPISYEETLENIRGNIEDAFIWAAVDETTDSVNRFIVNPVAGKLATEVPSNPHLIRSEDLHHTSHSTVARFVNDELIKCCGLPGSRGAAANFVSRCCGTYTKAATALKVFYPNLIHFTCLAHGLQLVAEEVIAKFP
jgi:hypothetical protein